MPVNKLDGGFGESELRPRVGVTPKRCPQLTTSDLKLSATAQIFTNVFNELQLQAALHFSFFACFPKVFNIAQKGRH